MSTKKKSNLGFIQHHFPPKSGAGFTLIEILLYSAILSIFIGLAFFMVSQTLDTTRKLRSKLEVTEETEFITKKIDWAIIDASAITSPAQNATSTTLTVNKTNFSNNPLSFTWDGLNVYLTRGASSPPIQLNNSKMRVSSVLFENVRDSVNDQSILRVTIVGQNRSINDPNNFFNVSTTIQTAYTL